MQIRENLINLRNELAKLRVQYDDAKRLADSARATNPIFETENVAHQLLRGADTDIRHVALELYLETQDKKLVDGISVKETTKVNYDNIVAYKWALDRLITLILGLHAKHKDIQAIVNELYTSATFMTLDSNAFEAAVKGGLNGLPATVIKVPQVNIASDLSQYIEANPNKS